MTTSDDDAATADRDVAVTDGDTGSDLEGAIAASLDEADAEEAAAVAVAVGAHLRDRELRAAAGRTDSDETGWTGRKWQYADRLGRAVGRSVRVSEGAPDDPWTTAGRVDRV